LAIMNLPGNTNRKNNSLKTVVDPSFYGTWSLHNFWGLL
jgi:hypothetical protein